MKQASLDLRYSMMLGTARRPLMFRTPTDGEVAAVKGEPLALLLSKQLAGHIADLKATAKEISSNLTGPQQDALERAVARMQRLFDPDTDQAPYNVYDEVTWWLERFETSVGEQDAEVERSRAWRAMMEKRLAQRVSHVRLLTEVAGLSDDNLADRIRWQIPIRKRYEQTPLIPLKELQDPELLSEALDYFRQHLQDTAEGRTDYVDLAPAALSGVSSSDDILEALNDVKRTTLKRLRRPLRGIKLMQWVPPSLLLALAVTAEGVSSLDDLTFTLPLIAAIFVLEQATEKVLLRSHNDVLRRRLPSVLNKQLELELRALTKP